MRRLSERLFVVPTRMRFPGTLPIPANPTEAGYIFSAIPCCLEGSEFNVASIYPLLSEDTLFTPLGSLPLGRLQCFYICRPSGSDRARLRYLPARPARLENVNIAAISLQACLVYICKGYKVFSVIIKDIDYQLSLPEQLDLTKLLLPKL